VRICQLAVSMRMLCLIWTASNTGSRQSRRMQHLLFQRSSKFPVDLKFQVSSYFFKFQVISIKFQFPSLRSLWMFSPCACSGFFLSSHLPSPHRSCQRFRPPLTLGCSSISMHYYLLTSSQIPVGICCYELQSTSLTYTMA